MGHSHHEAICHTVFTKHQFTSLVPPYSVMSDEILKSLLDLDSR